MPTNLDTLLAAPFYSLRAAAAFTITSEKALRDKIRAMSLENLFLVVEPVLL
jgi:hypothetical protein